MLACLQYGAVSMAWCHYEKYLWSADAKRKAGTAELARHCARVVLGPVPEEMRHGEVCAPQQPVDADRVRLLLKLFALDVLARSADRDIFFFAADMRCGGLDDKNRPTTENSQDAVH